MMLHQSGRPLQTCMIGQSNIKKRVYLDCKASKVSCQGIPNVESVARDIVLAIEVWLLLVLQLLISEGVVVVVALHGQEVVEDDARQDCVDGVRLLPDLGHLHQDSPPPLEDAIHVLDGAAGGGLAEIVVVLVLEEAAASTSVGLSQVRFARVGTITDTKGRPRTPRTMTGARFGQFLEC